MSSSTYAPDASDGAGSPSPARGAIRHEQQDQLGITSTSVERPSAGPLHPVEAPLSATSLSPHGIPPPTSSQLGPPPGSSPGPIHGHVSSESPPSQQSSLPPADPHQVQSTATVQVRDFDRDSQETIVRPRVFTSTHQAHPQSAASSPPPSTVDLSYSTRPRTPTRSEGNQSSQQPVQTRVLPESAFTRSPVHHSVHTHGQLHSDPPPSQEGHGTLDSETETDTDQRRAQSRSSLAAMRKHQPLPPLPRATNPGMSQSPSLSVSNPHDARRPQSAESAVSGQSAIDRNNGLAGNGRSNVVVSSLGLNAGTPGATGTYSHEPETNETRPSIVPGLATVTSHPTLERSRTLRSGVDWVSGEDKTREKTVGERLDPTLDTARVERAKYALKAKMTGYTLNIAIGLQVLIGALTTGLSAATTGRQTSIMTAILGGIATMVASYLARARGSNEPELSIARVKDLEHFIRECETFKLDYGHLRGSTNPKYHKYLDELRDKFEELLGSANGERRLAPPV